MKTHKELKNIVQPDKEDLVKDSLIGDYPRYVDYLERHEWTRESITITELLSRITTISKLKAGNDGTVLDIKCPAGLIISVPGTEGIQNGYDIEKIRPLEVKFSDSNGREICPDTCIKIFKHKLLKKDVQIGQVLYRDISMVDYSDFPNLFKSYSELYRFDKGIEINIEDIEFNINLDRWNIDNRNR